MDKEDKILNLMEKMYTELSGKMDKMDKELITRMDNMYAELSGRIDKINIELSGRMDNMYTELSNKIDKMNNRFDAIDNRLNSVENRLDRVEFNQEKMHTDIQTIAEVQANHMEQNAKQHDEIMETIENKTALIKEAVKHIAGETTMNTAELSLLKRQMG